MSCKFRRKDVFLNMQNYQQPENGLSFILRQAFFYWNKALLYHLVFSLLYFTLFMAGYFYLVQYFGLWDEFMKYRDLVQTDLPAFNKKMEEIAKTPQAANFTLAFFGLIALLNPLNVGLYKIYRKIELKEPVFFNDLFAGYQGSDFFSFVGFYLFWMIIFTYANAFLFLGVAWIFLTLFCVPLMFFLNVKIFKAIGLTWQVLRYNFSTVVIAMVVALLFSLSGILLCGIGFVLTFPFFNSMIYVLYRYLYKEVEEN